MDASVWRQPRWERRLVILRDDLSSARRRFQPLLVWSGFGDEINWQRGKVGSHQGLMIDNNKHRVIFHRYLYVIY